MRGKRALDGIDQDIRDHIERETQDNIDRGMAPEEARRQTMLKFGSVALAAEDTRAVWSWPWLDEVRQDARYALRSLRRAPGFALVAVLTLALGIGATTAIYSVVDAILLQPLPFAESDRLVRVVERAPGFNPGDPPREERMNEQELLEWRARTRTLSDVIAVTGGAYKVRTRQGMAQLWGNAVSVNTFTLLGTRAVLGRTFDPGDEANPGVILLSFDTWRQHFRSDPGVVGRTIETRSLGLRNNSPHLLRVIGVLPDGFVFPAGHADYYVPFVPTGAPKEHGGITLIGRLAAGVSLQAAMDEAHVLGNALLSPRSAKAAALPGPRVDVHPLKDHVVQDLRPALRVLLGAVAVVLMIVCANVANLLLARGTVRQREIAVRLAIGASRGRVVRQVLTECVVLALAGGVLGALLGAAGVTLVKQLATIESPGIYRLMFGSSLLPRMDEVGIDVQMFLVAFGVAAMASVLFGVLPALHLSRTNYLQAMGPRGGGSSRGASRIRATLVVGQLVMATVLLVGAGLLAHSFVRLTGVNRGYNPANVLAMQVVFPPDYTPARKSNTIEAILARLRSVPDVEAAGFSRAGMLIGEQIVMGTFVPRGRTQEEMRAPGVEPSLRPVGPGFLTAMGVPVLEGRDLDMDDRAGATPAIVISRSVARQFPKGASPVGQFVNWHLSNEEPPLQVQVVGVVEDLRNVSADSQPYPEVFVDYLQVLALERRSGASPIMQEESALGRMSFAIRTRNEPAYAAPIVEQIVRAVDPGAGIDALVPVDRLVASSVAQPRFYAVMLGLFAAVAALLAAIGIYGVLAYAVIQRTQEIGIRIALGARRAQVLALVLRKGLILTTIGVALGLVGAAAATRVLQGMLFGITPLDPKTFIAVPLLFGVVAMLASFVPARRATKVDPMVALRRE